MRSANLQLILRKIIISGLIVFMKTPFIWLGSKRAKKRGVASIGSQLDYAARSGLPVANGAILLHEFYQLLLDEELIHWQNGRFHVDDPLEIHDALYQAVRFPKINKPVTVRPAFNAPQIHPVGLKPVQFTEASQLSHILCEIWQAAGAPTTDIRRDILIQEKQQCQIYGTALSKQTQEVDQIFYNSINDVHTHLATDFEKSLPIERLSRWQSPAKNLPQFAQRLQKLLRGIRRTFGDASWRIMWEDNGRICWLNTIEKTN